MHQLTRRFGLALAFLFSLALAACAPPPDAATMQALGSGGGGGAPDTFVDSGEFPANTNGVPAPVAVGWDQAGNNFRIRSIKYTPTSSVTFSGAFWLKLYSFVCPFGHGGTFADAATNCMQIAHDDTTGETFAANTPRSLTADALPADGGPADVFALFYLRNGTGLIPPVEWQVDGATTPDEP